MKRIVRILEASAALITVFSAIEALVQRETVVQMNESARAVASQPTTLVIGCVALLLAFAIAVMAMVVLDRQL